MESRSTQLKDSATTAHTSLALSVQKKRSDRLALNKYAAFILTALLYSLCHATRTTWGYVKPYLSTAEPYYTTSKLGILDFLFMMSYSVGQYISGWMGDRVNLKVFLFSGLTLGMFSFCLFGVLEGFAHVNNLGIGIFIFMLNGLGQSTGFPSCISIVSNWFISGKIGLVFGLWGTSLNIGDIIGQQIGRFAINQEGLDWQYAVFIVAGVLMFFLINVTIFVKISPKHLENQEREQDALIEAPEHQPRENTLQIPSYGQSQEPLPEGHRPERAIGFLKAWKIKNVPYFAFGFFCVKGVIYGIMFWLPFYLAKNVGFDGDISILLAAVEIGMLLGSILLGYLSDRINSRAIMISFGFFFAVIFLLFTYFIKDIKLKALYFVLLLLAGMGIGGPSSLIGGAVSSDIGHEFAQKNSINAIATITGIMEGCGGLGAAVTQLVVSNFTPITFPLFAALCLLGGILILPIAVGDYKRLKKQYVVPSEEPLSDPDDPQYIRF